MGREEPTYLAMNMSVNLALTNEPRCKQRCCGRVLNAKITAPKSQAEKKIK